MGIVTARMNESRPGPASGLGEVFVFNHVI